MNVKRIFGIQRILFLFLFTFLAVFFQQKVNQNTYSQNTTNIINYNKNVVNLIQEPQFQNISFIQGSGRLNSSLKPTSEVSEEKEEENKKNKPDETNGTNEKDKSVEPIEPVELFETKSATVKVEKWISIVNKGKIENGYIDIYIKNSANQSIIIENKIYAGDQKEQLRRYHNFDKTAKLVYLTLDGKQANDDTTKNGVNPTDEINPICISYADHIKDWLEECREKATNHPILRETITQYIYLIKYLTNQATNKNMENDLVSLILGNPEYIKSVQQINAVWSACQFQIIQNLKTPIEEIAKELALEHNFSAGKLGESNPEFWFYKEGKSYCIYFEFEKEFNLMRVGIHNVSNEIPCTKDIRMKLKTHFSDFQLNGENPLACSDADNDWIWVSPFKDWESTSWADVARKLPNAIRETTKIILAKLESFEKPSI